MHPASPGTWINFERFNPTAIFTDPMKRTRRRFWRRLWGWSYLDCAWGFFLDVFIKTLHTICATLAFYTIFVVKTDRLR
jgi:hypothetical protein